MFPELPGETLLSAQAKSRVVVFLSILADVEEKLTFEDLEAVNVLLR